MAQPVNIQVRCDDETANKFSEAANAFGMTYGEFVWFVSLYALDNREDFKRYYQKEKRRREKRR